MTPEPDISIRIFSEPQLLSGIRALVDAVGVGMGFFEKSRCLMSLAIDEALSNVIRHGYEGRKDGMIWIHIWRIPDPRGLRFVIEDLARAVDPAKIKGRHLDDVRPGGLGVHIITETMSDVAWEVRKDGGMRLTMSKRLSDEERQAVEQATQGNTNS